MKKKHLITVIICFILSLIFFVSAVGKLVSPDKFLLFISSSNWMNWLNPKLTLYIFICVELFISITLLLSSTRWIGIITSLGVLLLFTIILVLISMQGNQSVCGCFGEYSLIDESIYSSIVRNIVLIFLSLILMKNYSIED